MKTASYLSQWSLITSFSDYVGPIMAIQRQQMCMVEMEEVVDATSFIRQMETF